MELQESRLQKTVVANRGVVLMRSPEGPPDTQNQCAMSSTNWTRVVRKAANQCIPVLVFGGLLLLNNFLVRQRMAGFVVGDPSLSYPIVEETLSTAAAAGIMFLYPCIALVLHCIIKGRKLRHYNRSLLVYWWDKTWCAMMLSFAFITLSEFMKRFVGRLRPNFFALCNPSYNASLGAEVGGSLKQLYISDYVCLNETSGEAARSFPSGHSLFAVYLFTAMGYLLETHTCHDPAISSTSFNQKIVLDPTWGFRLLVQIVLTLIIGPAIAITRYTEHYHHASDVALGIILGYVCFFCLVQLERIFVKDPVVLEQQLDKDTKQEHELMSNMPPSEDA